MFVFVLFLLGVYVAIKSLVDSRLGRKLDVLCRRYPWQMRISVAFLLVAVLIWRVVTFRVVH